MNETIKSLTTRKSCKSYQNKHVDKELIEQIVAAGLNAPSGMNRQTACFAVVTDLPKEKLLKKVEYSQING